MPNMSVRKRINIKISLTFGLGLVTSAYFILMSDAFFYFIPEAYWDDQLQFRLASNISEGRWLGEYDAVTLAKGVTYPIWLALLHTLDISLWFGNALLYSSAALSLVYAVRKLVIHKWALIGLYTVILFNPMITARAYRDSIAPALILFVLAWVIGMFLSLTPKKPREVNSWPRRDVLLFTAIGMVGLPAWWFLREDYFWILPFVIGGPLLTLGIVSVNALITKQGWTVPSEAGAIIVLPFLMVVLAGFTISTLNERNYGRFVVNDYTSSDFRGAYGALTRIENDNWKPTVPISFDMRQKAYAVSPAFRELQPCLDDNGIGGCEFFKVGADPSLNDYQGGWFFWALRMAADVEGYYQNPTKSQKFYTRLASEINRACDTDKIECEYGERASLAPPFNPKIVKPVIGTTLSGVEYITRLSDVHTNRAVILDPYSPEREITSDYTDGNYHVEELNLGAHAKRKMQGVIANIYTVINPVLLMLALAVLLFATVYLKRFIKYWRALLIAWALLLLIALRLVMIAYVDTTSFPAVKALYLSSTYPIMFAFEGIVLGVAFSAYVSNRKTTR